MKKRNAVIDKGLASWVAMKKKDEQQSGNTLAIKSIITRWYLFW